MVPLSEIKLVPNSSDYITFIKTTCEANGKPVPPLSSITSIKPNYLLLELCGLTTKPSNAPGVRSDC